MEGIKPENKYGQSFDDADREFKSTTRAQNQRMSEGLNYVSEQALGF